MKLSGIDGKPETSIMSAAREILPHYSNSSSTKVAPFPSYQISPWHPFLISTSPIFPAPHLIQNQILLKLATLQQYAVLLSWCYSSMSLMLFFYINLLKISSEKWKEKKIKEVKKKEIKKQLQNKKFREPKWKKVKDRRNTERSQRQKGNRASRELSPFTNNKGYSVASTVLIALQAVFKQNTCVNVQHIYRDNIIFAWELPFFWSPNGQFQLAWYVTGEKKYFKKYRFPKN